MALQPSYLPCGSGVSHTRSKSRALRFTMSTSLAWWRSLHGILAREEYIKLWPWLTTTSRGSKYWGNI